MLKRRNHPKHNINIQTMLLYFTYYRVNVEGPDLALPAYKQEVNALLSVQGY